MDKPRITTKDAELVRLVGGQTFEEKLSNWKADHTLFWRNVLDFSMKHRIAFGKLIKEIIRRSDTRRKTKEYHSPNFVKQIVEELFTSRGSLKDFAEQLVTKRGSAPKVVQFIRQRLAISGTRENIIPSLSAQQPAKDMLKRWFIRLLSPTPSRSGYRVDLVSAVQLAVFLRLDTLDLTDVGIDIWGDGCEIGGRDETRICFRIISPEIQGLSPQSPDAVFSFAVYYGKDSRFGMEENLGCTVAGDETTGWLYMQTKRLHDLGVILTYTADSPFISRIILGIASDKSSPTLMPVYIPFEKTPASTDNREDIFLPGATHAETHRRFDLDIPFRNQDEIPDQCMIYISDIRQVIPDPVHLIIRCVEFDLRHMAQLLCREKHPFEEPAIRELEKRLSAREVHRPAFKFTIEKRTSTEPGTVASVSLTGTETKAVLADATDFQIPGSDDTQTICDLYSTGVWMDEKFGRQDATAIDVLKSLGYEFEDAIFYRDLAEILRSSLNQCLHLLRNAYEFDIEQFKIHAEAYFQCSIALFGADGITGYKAKLMLFPQLIKAGYMKLPFSHLTEATEKSNHHAHRDYNLHTTRGGGKLINEDPTYQDLYFSYMSLVSDTITENTMSRLEEAYYDIHGHGPLPEEQRFLDIATQPIPEATLREPGTPTHRPLGGMRFMLLGRFGAKTTQKEVTAKIEKLGGTVLDNEKAWRIMKAHSKAPLCFIVLPNDNSLKELKENAESQNPIDLKQLQLQQTKQHKQRNKRSVLSQAAKDCVVFGGGDFKFLNVSYIYAAEKSMSVEDPAAHLMKVPVKIPKIIVKDMRALFMNQRITGTSERTISTTARLKRAARMRQQQFLANATANKRAKQGPSTSNQ